MKTKNVKISKGIKVKKKATAKIIWDFGRKFKLKHSSRELEKYADNELNIK